MTKNIGAKQGTYAHNPYPMIFGKDKPNIEVYKNSVIFRPGENGIEYTWQEIYDLVVADHDNYMAYHDKG